MDPLSELAQKYGTDKYEHGFCPFYHKHMGPVRHEVRTVLEVGVLAGASLRMWREYFPGAMVYGIDNKMSGSDFGPRIKVLYADARLRRDMHKAMARVGVCDLIVHGGSHTMLTQQVTLGCLFKYVKPGGFFVVEDLHTSFVDRIQLCANGEVVGSYPTGRAAIPKSTTTYAILKRLRDGGSLSSKHGFMGNRESSYLERHTSEVLLFDRDGDKQHITSLIRKTDGQD